MKLIFIILFSLSMSAQMIEPDKTLHLLAGGLTSALTYHLIENNGGERPLLWSIVSATSIGIVKESFDLARGGKFDFKDLGVTVLGGVTISVSFEITNKRKYKRWDNL